ncbi:MAG: L-rhamnose/proton symporter RhaT [Acidobacteria bacterium]|nr:L-rhamnose/proton symporter RhaT [Acidobacteriota bacterium]
MHSNPALGVLFHWLGGLASGSFYVPFKGVKKWSWETYWLVGGFFSWIIAPFFFGTLIATDLLGVLSEAPGNVMFWCYFFGALWGLGGLTFGLTMRYLGMSLGMAIALGYCAAFGTLMPPIFSGEFVTKVLHTASGQVILVGIGVCLAGIAAAGMAGMSKEREMPDEKKREAIQEFDLKKGIMVATFSGVMSACFSYGLSAGDPIKEIALRHGTTTLWQGLPVLVVVLWGGFTTNFIWCVMLHRKNGSAYQYLSPTVKEAGPGGRLRDVPAPRMRNYIFSAIAGTTWYLQFFFYSMGETQMGEFKFSSWTLHMASIIIFSTLWGIALHEWRGASARTVRWVVLSLALLIASTVVVGYGNYLGASRAVVWGGQSWPRLAFPGQPPCG